MSTKHSFYKITKNWLNFIAQSNVEDEANLDTYNSKISKEFSFEQKVNNEFDK